MQDNIKERMTAKIKAKQDEYVDSQLDLYDRILRKVEKQYESAVSYTILNNITLAIYQGYILSDIDDALRGVLDEPRKI